MNGDAAGRVRRRRTGCLPWRSSDPSTGAERGCSKAAELTASGERERERERGRGCARGKGSDHELDRPSCQSSREVLHERVSVRGVVVGSREERRSSQR